MPTITFDRKAFEALLGKTLALEVLKDRISYLGTDLEEVSDESITVEVFPNRPDMLSVQGFARAFSSFIGNTPGLRKYAVEPSGEKVVIDGSVSKVRPFTACAIVKGISFDDQKIKEAIDIQEKLHITFGRHRKKVAIGIYPFEKIRPPIRFVAKKPEEIRFRPLESPGIMSASQILAEHPAGREYGKLLDGCATYPVFIDSNDEVLSMPPIINSHNVGKISGETKDVFIECSGFDFSVLHKCLNMIVAAFADMGGKVFSMKLEYPDCLRVTPDLAPSEVVLDIGYVNRLLGLDISAAKAKLLLGRMGYGITGKKVLVPAYRADIIHAADLAEDIAIAYGYENFVAEIPKVATIAQESRVERFKSILAEILIGFGMIEVSTYHIASSVSQNENMLQQHVLVELSNSVSSGYNVLRHSTLPSLLEVLKANKHNEYPQRIFTMGKAFSASGKTETGVVEKESLSVVIADEKAGYTEIRQVADYLMRMLSIQCEVKDCAHDSFIPGRVAAIVAGGCEIAYLGELSPRVISNFDLALPLAAMELNVDEALRIIQPGE